LLANGDRVRVVDSRDDREHVPEGAEFNPADVTDYSQVVRSLGGIDVVFDLAGTVLNVARKNPRLAVSLDVMDTCNVLEACVEKKVTKVVYASSFYAYDGLEPGRTVSEENHADIFSAEMFGVVKLMGERLVREYSKARGLRYVILRYGPVYGPDERCTCVIYDFLKAGLDGRSLVIWGKGERKNQYTYVEDVARATASSLTRENEVFNVISPEQLSLRQVAEMISKEYGFQVEYELSTAEGPSLPYISPRKALEELKWKPMTLSEGLRETVQAMRAHSQKSLGIA